MSEMGTQDFWKRIAPLEKTYEASPAVHAQIGRISLTTVSGPSASGKDTIKQLTGLPLVIGDTTRERRMEHGEWEVDGKNYHFRGGELAAVWDDVEAGRYVQIAPVLGYLYGSRASAYPDEGLALFDVVPATTQNMRHLPFQQFHSAYVVAQSYSEWIKRLESRGPLPHDQIATRMHEAADSLRVGLDDTNFQVIVNRDRQEASRYLKEVTLYGGYDDQLEKIARETGHSILRELIYRLDLPRTFGGFSASPEQ